MTMIICISLKLVVILRILQAESADAIPSQHEFCSETNVALGEPDSRALIKSEGYPNVVPDEDFGDHDCFMYIKACEGCYMKVAADDLQLPECNRPIPEQGSCIEQCDHLIAYEPDYPERSTNYIFGGQDNKFFYTHTRNVFIKFCRTTSQNANMLFSLYIDVLDKTQFYYDSPLTGYITSPFFPEKYNAYVGLDLYPYVLAIQGDWSRRVKVTFTDWNLMPESYIKISFDDEKSNYITRNGGEKRPFVISTGNRLYFDFYTGKEDSHYIPGLPYPGFQLKYEFIREESWPDKPTPCGQYFKNVWGGNFTFGRSAVPCNMGDKMDCIWVFTKQNNQQSFPKVELVISDLSLDNTDFMEIRRGTVSSGEIIADTRSLGGIEVGRIYSDPNGMYVRLQSECQWDKFVKATFVSVVSEQREWDCDYVTSGFWCNNWGRCIHNSLQCDGVDHCGNGQDEHRCPDEPDTCHRALSCESENEWYCVAHECDGIQQCSDGTDEKHCGGSNNNQGESNSNLMTIVPAIVVPIILGLCICAFLIYCVYKSNKRKRARRRQDPYVQQPHSVPRSSFIATPPPGHHGAASPPFAIGGFMAYPESPPSYEASQQHVNMAYMRSNSEEVLGKPPPYQLPSPVGTSPPRSVLSSSPPNQNTSLSNQSRSPSVQEVSDTEASRSLTGAGALHSLSLTGIVPNFTPNNKRQSAVEASKENERNMNLEAMSRGDTEAKSPHKGQHRATRAKKRLDLANEPSTSQSGGAEQPYVFDNGAYHMNTTDEDKHNVESSV